MKKENQKKGNEMNNKDKALMRSWAKTALQSEGHDLSPRQPRRKGHDRMTNNIDRAAEVIDAWTQEGHELNSYVGSPHDIARRLSDAGLLAPDLPQPYLRPVTAWQAKCSLCGYVQDDYGDFTAMDSVGVVEEVLAGGWVLEGDRLVCDFCRADHADA